MGSGRTGSDSDQEGKNKAKPEFEVKYIPIDQTCAVGTYNCSPVACTTAHSNAAKQGLDFRRMSLVARKL